MPAAPSSGASLGDLYSKCVQMVNENKISTKNAWELPLIDHMDDIVSSFMGGRKTKSGPRESSAGAGGGGRASTAGHGSGGGNAASANGTPASGTLEGDENRFHEASCTIEASARIYACRVDCVHTDTYRVLGGLNSADMGDEDDAQGEDGRPAAKKRRIVGVNTLEKNEASLIQGAIESDEQSDPSFRRMAAAFDAGGAKGLLLSHLPIAEDLSLVFNGDVPLSRAKANAEPMFAGSPKSFPSTSLGLGDDPVGRFGDARVCPGVDVFRQQFFGSANSKVALPDNLEALLGAAVRSGGAMGGGCAGLPPVLGDVGAPPPLADMDGGFGIPDPDMGGFPDAGGADDMDGAFPIAKAPAGNLALPLSDMEGAIVPVRANEDVIAFDELFQKFCGAHGGAHQFAYFDECWRKAAKEGGAKDGAGANMDGEEGALVPVEDTKKERSSRKPLFDLAGLDKPPKPIETEPVQKHQLSERAVQWQLHKDVPPYMIDRITMPSWPTWSRCDFACLGLRPHLMLKLMKKPPPDGEGPHRFTDLFSTVVVENPDAFPWLLADARAAAAGAGRSDDDDTGRAEREMAMGDDGDDDGFGANGGLPAHLDVDPQDLFLRPDDKVLPDSDHEDDGFGGGFGGGGGGFGGDMFGDDGPGGEENPFAMDFDLADKPATVGDTEIAYSRNSKFVDVKLVKKHLWDCINEEVEAAKAESKSAETSFQELVDQTVRRLPKAETPNLSVAVCFICALHLCNEKGLELKVDPEKLLGDFSVTSR